MKVAILSDLHGCYPKMPELFDQDIDLLLVVGDIAGGNPITHAQYKSMGKFFNWVQQINPKQCVLTPGNHDFWTWGDLFSYRNKPNNIHCLIDDWVDIDGLIIYGTPWCPKFLNWNWMKEDHDLKRHWEHINPKTHILINHSPAFGTCDVSLEGGVPYNHLGSQSLRDELLKREIPYFFSGHVHTASHELQNFDGNHPTQCACVSLMNEEYEIVFKPLIMDL